MNELNEDSSYIKATRGIDPDLPHHPSLVHMFRSAVEARPEVTAVVCEHQSITYAQFGRAVEGLARRLDQLGAAGRRAAVMMPNSIETDVAIMAVMAANAQVAPLNPFFTMRELSKVVELVDATVILCDPSTREKALEVAEAMGVPHVLTMGEGELALERWVDDASLDASTRPLPGPDDFALLIFTGGSTGTPKGVDHTHRALVWSLLQHCSVWPLDFGAERFLSVAPMFHIWGLSYAAWVPIFSCGTLVILPRYDPDKMVRAAGEHRITVFGGGPAPIYMGLLASPVFDDVDLSALKYCLSGGAPVPADLHREWEARTGCPLLEGWGMTEGAPFCLNPCDGRRKLMSVGNPVPETEVQVVDLETGTRVLPFGEAGEVRVRGPQLMTGYRNNLEETAQTLRDGWIYTGDIGYADREGYLFLVDRKKDIVIVGGYNVYPREVDEVLFHHPKIREAATVGRPDDRLGEVLVAFVVLARGESMDEEELFAYCKEKMVKYKRPVEVFFVDELPKTGPAKINRRALRERLAAVRESA